MKKLLSLLFAITPLLVMGAAAPFPPPSSVLFPFYFSADLATARANLGLGAATPLTSGTITSNQWVSLAVASAARTLETAKPPMGYYSYYSGDFCSPSETSILTVATNYSNDGLLAKGLCWMGIEEWTFRTNGVICANPTNFPHGMPWLVTTLHSMGFKVDLYMEVGTGGLTCCNLPASGGTNTVGDAKTVASWGIDGVHVDACHDFDTSDQKRWAHEFFYYCLLTNGFTGRYTVYVTPAQYSAGAGYPVFEPWMANFNSFMWTPEYSTYNTTNVWLDIIGHIDLASSVSGYIRRGHTLFMNTIQGDMRQYNYNFGRVTATFWSMFQSPLIYANDFLKDERAGIVGQSQFQTNDYIYRIDQDSLFIPPVKLFSNGTNTEIWVKPLDDGSKALAILNRWTNNENITVSLYAAGLSTNPVAPVVLYDVWGRTNFTPANASSVTFTSPPTSCALWILNPPISANPLTSVAGGASYMGTYLQTSPPPIFITNSSVAILKSGTYPNTITPPLAALDIEDPNGGPLLCLGDGSFENYKFQRDAGDGLLQIIGAQAGFNGIKFVDLSASGTVYFKASTNGITTTGSLDVAKSFIIRSNTFPVTANFANLGNGGAVLWNSNGVHGYWVSTNVIARTASTNQAW